MAVITGGGAGWITPEQQLQRLGQDKEGVIKELVGELPVVLATIVAEYALNPNLKKWYKALKELDILPCAIPPLPFEVRDNESLYLRPPLSANELEKSVSAYGKSHLGEQHPLKFRYFYTPARQEHGDVRPRQWQWISLTNDVLEASRGKTYSEQEELVAGLGVNYKIPTLLDVITVVFFDKITMGNNLFPLEGNSRTYTRVQEITHAEHLAVGGFVSDGSEPCYGLLVDPCVCFATESIGAAAVRRY